MTEISEEISKLFSLPFDRLSIGLLLQRVKAISLEFREEFPRCCMMLAYASELSSLPDLDIHCITQNSGFSPIFSKYKTASEFISREKLMGCWEMEPLVKGNKIKEKLKEGAPLTVISELVSQQIKLQIQHPEWQEQTMLQWLNENMDNFIEEHKNKKRKK